MSNIAAGTSGGHTSPQTVFQQEDCTLCSQHSKASGEGTPGVPGQLGLKLDTPKQELVQPKPETSDLIGNLDPPSKLRKYDVTIHSEHKLTLIYILQD